MNIESVEPLSARSRYNVYLANVVKQITERTLQLIKKERTGEQVNSTLIAKVIDSYVELGRSVSVAELKPDKTKYLRIYETKFLQDYLKETARFYSVESSNFIDENPVTEYLKKAETRLEEENVRCEKYLHESSVQKIRSTCELVLIDHHLDKFNTEFRALLEANKGDDLSRMFKMCQKVENGLAPFRSKFEEFIHQRGTDAISNIAHTPEPKLYVNTILDIYENFSRINQQSFNGEFKEALDRASSKFINK